MTYKRYSYHGTTKNNAEEIMKTGFKNGTWFALHLEDALEFGGNYIFRVGFNNKINSNRWQFRITKRILMSNRIISLRIYNVKTIKINR